jgi:hypothetical protein
MKNLKTLVTTSLFTLILGNIYAQDCSDLFISEYVEGSANSKAFEIYNPTNSIIELNRYYIARYSNGQSTYTKGGITQLQGFIQPRSTFVLVNGQKTSSQNSPACDPDLQALAQQLDHEYPSPTYMNGNDAIMLLYDPDGSGTEANFVAVDLFGIIGGGMTSNDEGWADFTNKWIYKNIYTGDIITGKDSAYVENYIVPEGYYWVPWTANHTLIRKHSVVKGVTQNPSLAFNVGLEWDTLAGGANIWDSLGKHHCTCENNTSVNKIHETNISIYPNPVSEMLTISGTEPITEVKVVSIDGKTIYTNNFKKISAHPVYVNVSQYTPGMYYFSVKTNNHRSIIKKIIIE